LKLERHDSFVICLEKVFHFFVYFEEQSEVVNVALDMFQDLLFSCKFLFFLFLWVSYLCFKLWFIKRKKDVLKCGIFSRLLSFLFLNFLCEQQIVTIGWNLCWMFSLFLFLLLKNICRIEGWGFKWLFSWSFGLFIWCQFQNYLFLWDRL